jgi:hypothetical protein
MGTGQMDTAEHFSGRPEGALLDDSQRRWPPADEQLYAEMGRFVEELTRAGVLLATGGLDRGTHVAASGGNITLTDGPFTESKEQIVSFALLEVRSRDEALELTRRFWKMVGDGEGDIRQVYGPEG